MREKGQIAAYYPVLLKVSGKRCVVIGGGPVAFRKARSLLEHGASVDVISPELCPALTDLAAEGQVRVFLRNYETGDLQGAFGAIAAPDDSEGNHHL